MSKSELQRLIECATQMFAEPGGNIPQIEGFIALLEQCTAEDFQVPSRISSWNIQEGWWADSLYANPDLQICLLYLPKGQSIPIHSHPGMTVFQKIVWGGMHLIAYDWAEEYPWTGLARKVEDRYYDASSGALLLLPRQKNLHTVHAMEDCVFLDVMSPPYSDADGRPCHYYAEEKSFVLQGESFIRLVRV